MISNLVIKANFTLKCISILIWKILEFTSFQVSEPWGANYLKSMLHFTLRRRLQICFSYHQLAY